MVRGSGDGRTAMMGRATPEAGGRAAVGAPLVIKTPEESRKRRAVPCFSRVVVRRVTPEMPWPKAVAARQGKRNRRATRRITTPCIVLPAITASTGTGLAGRGAHPSYGSVNDERGWNARSVSGSVSEGCVFDDAPPGRISTPARPEKREHHLGNRHHDKERANQGVHPKKGDVDPIEFASARDKMFQHEAGADEP